MMLISGCLWHGNVDQVIQCTRHLQTTPGGPQRQGDRDHQPATQTTQGKLKDLAAQSDQIETTLAQLNSCLHFIGESLKTGNEQDVLMMKTNTVNQAKELTTPFLPDFLMPDAEADMVFLASSDMTTSCQNYGKVHQIIQNRQGI